MNKLITSIKAILCQWHLTLSLKYYRRKQLTPKEILLVVKRMIVLHAEQFEMSNWHTYYKDIGGVYPEQIQFEPYYVSKEYIEGYDYGDDYIKDKKEAFCNIETCKTAHCIAGWVELIDNKYTKQPKNIPTLEKAITILKITDDQASNLFTESNWNMIDYTFDRQKYYNSTKKEKAMIACDIIDKFIDEYNIQ